MENKLDKKYEQRLAACIQCEYSKQLLNLATCGTPIVGETIIFNGESVDLCGCVMPIKTKLPKSKCPINKW